MESSYFIKIGLALSGGGVLGAAHIGVIEELAKFGIEPDFICGSSAGALIGLAYAINGLESLNAIFDELAGSRILANYRYLLAPRPDRLFDLLEKVFREYYKPDGLMRTKFACVATNIGTGESTVLDSGDQVKNVLASAAYPGVFSIQRIKDSYYFDGGITRNLPAGETRASGADFVIGSSIYSIAELKPMEVKKMNRLATVARSLDIYERELSRFEEKQCDFCFKPETQPFRWFNFSKIKLIKEAGRRHAAREIANLCTSLKK
jgi:NTE family protein